MERRASDTRSATLLRVAVQAVNVRQYMSDTPATVQAVHTPECGSAGSTDGTAARACVASVQQLG